MPRESLMRAIEESLCLENGSLLLFSPVQQQQQQLESIVGTAYAVTVGETIAVWNTTLKLTDQCPCDILTAAAAAAATTTTVCAMLSTSPNRPVVGATEMGGLADFHIVKLTDVQQVIKGNVGQSLSETELNHCAGWRGLRRLLRKWSSVYS
ncbi:unnamed protein product [Dibothriocephalus latus]|uniref:Uncharacterized protein n=1 Tax=Dibothriocephalus latus TaxID=60516 RepID=A0A3P7PMC6_DIBLA|nr:unnamed protein product [Dibothriocephalus latus]